MIYSIVKLHEVFKGLPKEQEATLTCYIASNSHEIEANRKKPSIVICPGGGYGFVSDREAEPVALTYLAKGYNAFVLRYSIAPTRYPQQLLELSAAVAYVRRMADAWPIDLEKIAVCGFSAGGHLTGNLGVAWQEDFIQQQLGINKGENKPNRVILSYPVITSGEFAHRGSFNNLLGEDATPEMLNKVSLEKQVTADMPPTFLWHTYEDAAVPIENSLLFAMALRKNKILFEAHFYEKGGHGLSLANHLTASPHGVGLINEQVQTWVDLTLGWLAW